MDPSSHTNFYHHGYQILSPIKNHQQSSIYKTPSHSPDTSSPILVIALLGIMTTAFLLVGYYVFVIKCWLNFHQIDVVRRFSFRQARRSEDPLMGYDSARPSHGVDESVIRTIPIVQFKGEGLEISYLECAVCLNEFQEEEKLRVLPSCTHAFHIDCIDIWLQNNANCPLCRSSISTTTRFPLDQIIAPTTSPQDQTPFTETVISSDENFVVIEIRGDDDSDRTSSRRLETEKSGEFSVQSSNHSPRKLEQRTTMDNKKGWKFHHVSSMGDECIDIRGKDDQFKVQPIRRSISMDSSADRLLYLAVQEIIQQKQNRHFNEVSTSEGCSSSSSSSKVRRSFFSFGHSRGSSRSAVLPIQFE